MEATRKDDTKLRRWRQAGTNAKTMYISTSPVQAVVTCPTAGLRDKQLKTVEN